jgi:hypothetical protein
LAAGAAEVTDVHATFEAVRAEVDSSKGGVAYMAECLENDDFTSLLEFTKTYDQILRKSLMGRAKKSVEDKERATQLANNVTFDLIGINRNSRKGQENKEKALQYVQELRQDVKQFLELEPKA